MGSADVPSKVQETVELLSGRDTSALLDSIPPNIRSRVETLREFQKEHDELEAKFYEEKAALEAKYQKLYDPLYSKRHDVVNGVTVSGEETKGETNTAENDVKGIPDFWLIALKNNEVCQEQISERDEGALKFLKDIKWCGLPEGKGFKLEFFFNENPYFKNSVLTKTYYMIDDEEPILEKAEGTEIQWNPGKNLTQRILKKKPRKGAKNAKPITKTEDCESFFNFFDPPQVPADEEEIEEEDAEVLQEQMEADYEIGSTLKEKIIPHAVSWYTGEAAEDDVDYDNEDDDDDDDADDVDEEDDDDDDDDDDDENPRGKTVRPIWHQNK